jgi:hypothetical protein
MFLFGGGLVRPAWHKKKGELTMASAAASPRLLAIVNLAFV